MVICCLPHQTGKTAQGLFGGSGRRAGAHTRPAFSKIPTVPSASPLLGAPRASGNKPNHPVGGKSLGVAPEAGGNHQSTSHTRPDPRPPRTRLNKARPIDWCANLPELVVTSYCYVFRYLWRVVDYYTESIIN